MAIIESNLKTNDLVKSVLFICPICKIKKQVNIPKSIINEAKQLTSISISKDIVCDHHFQAFVDKNFVVRGYQKVDYQIENQTNEKDGFSLNSKKESNDELLNNLILEGNYLEYKPKRIFPQNTEKFPRNTQEIDSKEKKMSLEHIYEEFWEFIPDDNEEFSEYIRKDTRRRNMNLEVPV
jgi:hypothetical protein